jgi:hypothetical protein
VTAGDGSGGPGSTSLAGHSLAGWQLAAAAAQYASGIVLTSTAAGRRGSLPLRPGAAAARCPGPVPGPLAGPGPAGTNGGHRGIPALAPPTSGHSVCRCQCSSRGCRRSLASHQLAQLRVLRVTGPPQCARTVGLNSN